jgi:hypothetical protein
MTEEVEQPVIKDSSEVIDLDEILTPVQSPFKIRTLSHTETKEVISTVGEGQLIDYKIQELAKN